MQDVLVKVENISKKFCRNFRTSLWYGLQDISREVAGLQKHPQLRKNEFHAVMDVSFQLKRGECLGIIGPNGAGKSTLLKILTGLLKPETGYVSVKGRVCALIQLTAGFNTLLTGRENIYIKGAILGMSKMEVDGKIDDIIDFAEVRDAIDSPVQTYSSGMVARLGFSIAVHTDPDVLIVDEVLAVGDAGFRNKCFARIKQICEKAAVIFISHNIHSVNRICDRIILMDQGKVIHEYADIATGIEKYLELFRQIKPRLEQKKQINIDSIKINDAPLAKQHSVPFGSPLKLTINGTAMRNLELEVRIYFLSLNLENLAVISSEEDGNVISIDTDSKFFIEVIVPQVLLGVEKSYITLQLSDKHTGERIYQNYAMTLLSVTGHHEPYFSPNIYRGQWSVERV